MVEHVDRHPSVRDRAIFIGDRDDAIDVPLGPGLPTIHQWSVEHFEFVGYVNRFGAVAPENRRALRAELGYSADEHVCVVTVGGSGVGERLLQRAAAAASGCGAAVRTRARPAATDAHRRRPADRSLIPSAAGGARGAGIRARPARASRRV